MCGIICSMTEKVTGYILLAVGLAIIIFSGLNVYQVFTKQIEPIQLFNFSGVALDMGSMLGAPENLTPEQQAYLRQQTSTAKPQELISADMINQTSNVAAHLFLMGFVATVGYKIASLGIQLMRPIVVQLREGKISKS